MDEFRLLFTFVKKYDIIILELLKGEKTMSYKDECKMKAILHTKEMEKKYSNEIKYSIEHTKVYHTDFMIPLANYTPKKAILVPNTTTEAIFRDYTSSNKIAVLNFASYKNPGGQFINGSMAQEECLCHDSFLYNVLKEQKDYYEWNNKYKNNALYLNRALYSENIKFFYNDENKIVDVITCAAPNYKAARRFELVTPNMNLQVLKSRIKFVLDIAQYNNVDTLILGAFGCGVFGQDAEIVAIIFKKLLKEYYSFNNVIFAIPNNNENFNKFKRGLETECE